MCVCAILHLGCSIAFYTLLSSSEPTQPTSILRAEPTHSPTLYSRHPFTAARARPANSHYPITLSGNSSPPPSSFFSRAFGGSSPRAVVIRRRPRGRVAAGVFGGGRGREFSQAGRVVCIPFSSRAPTGSLPVRWEADRRRVCSATPPGRVSPGGGGEEGPDIAPRVHVDELPSSPTFSPPFSFWPSLAVLARVFSKKIH
jgi:hypothetical protein